MRTILLSIGIVLLSSMAFRPSAPESVDICSLENLTFQDGEVIVYKLYYNWNFIWLAAGEVIFKVEETDDRFVISARGRTYPSYEWFFTVRDYFESQVDKETLLPKLSIRDVHEGSYTRYDKIEFDQEERKATYYWGPNKEGELKAGVKDVDNCMHDILSIFYSLRNADISDFEPGAKFPVEVFLDKEVWPLQVEYQGEVNKRIRGQGKMNTIHFSPELVSGNVFSEGTKMDVYVSNDDNRIPVLMESPVSVGSVKAVISSWRGLKHPLKHK